MKMFSFSRVHLVLGLGLVLVLLLGAYLYLSGLLTLNPFATQSVRTDGATIEVDYNLVQKDLEALKDVPGDFASIREFFVRVADERGGVHSFEVLKRAVLPPNTDLHLMGHAVGDELYKQEGLDGMKYCTHDFRNACSHSIVIGALLEDGLAVFDKVNDVCKQAPGGPGAYTMCFHGFGHGVLAYTEYEMPEAVKLCAKAGTKEYGFQEEYQCIGGIVMEMDQGMHDPELWEQKKDKYLTPDDPLRICEEDYMPENAKVLCYSYITPYIFKAAGAVNGNPTPDIYTKSFAYCDDVEGHSNRESCYAGLGKEFIVLAQDRDIRRIEDTPDDRLQLAASWCMLAEKAEAQEACLTEILDSIFWGGENDPEVSVRYCSLLEGEMVNECFDHMFTITTYYVPDMKQREHICSIVPKDQAEKCRAKILSR
jgi:hypothetical protein